MKLFINDIPIIFCTREELKEPSWYATVLDGKITDIKSGKIRFIDDVLINDAPKEMITDLFKLMTDKKLAKVDSVTVEVRDEKAVKNYIKSVFTIVKAGGGVVDKGDDILLIHRLGKWDLPKGKLEKNESAREGAKREVEEETGVIVELGPRICSTWHTYTRNKKYVLKKTNWYKMKCIDDTYMSPQTEEDIMDVQWMDTPQVRNALYESYRTIRYVVQEYNKL
ncbi:MAG: NUDIX hydrolase [Cyclobacteriaceae bacterium]